MKTNKNEIIGEGARPGNKPGEKACAVCWQMLRDAGRSSGTAPNEDQDRLEAKSRRTYA